MDFIPLSIPILTFIVGFFIGRQFTKGIKTLTPAKPSEKLKVLHKAEPTTYQEKVIKALDNNKPLVKTFYK